MRGTLGFDAGREDLWIARITAYEYIVCGIVGNGLWTDDAS